MIRNDYLQAYTDALLEIEKDKEIQKEYDADQNKVVKDSHTAKVQEKRQICT